ncbi:MAG: PrsW family intramembrane metalloprotease [Candidatus Spechtbacterales bacterium]
MQYLIYIPLALIPSLIWLLWYLHKDKHPEPKTMVISVFIWGMLIAFPAILIENTTIEALRAISLPRLPYIFILYFAGVAATEEILKYLVVYFRVIKRTNQLDEPTDAMIYMIIAALGFAAIENIFLLAPLFDKNFLDTLGIAFSRFVGATLLHALASAIIGYYLAISLFRSSKKFSALIPGFTLAILLHGFYNILIIYMEDQFYFIFVVALMLISAAVLISMFFTNLSKIKSTTKIK